VGQQSLLQYLRPPRYSDTELERDDRVGVATGLAWTEAGGEILYIEVSAIRGKGSLTMTGQLGDVMQESAQAALTYIRSRANELGIADLDFDKIDVHIHVPEGAVPKDGPSAGVTIVVALTSALTGRPVRHDVALTGEITLRGRVLPIGGLREKALAARRMGIKRIVLPKGNSRDLVELPKRLRRDLELIFVESMDDVLPVALSDEVDETARIVTDDQGED